MKLNMKSTARLAVSAGLCASLVMGGMPLTAIADELEIEKSGQVEAPVDGQAPSDGQGPAAGEAAAQEAPLADETPAPAAEDDAKPAEGDAQSEADGVKPTADEVTGLTGEGTEAKPYLVSSVAELQFVAKKVNDGEASYVKAHYKLTDNINLADVDWAPIGTSTHKFAGTFDGAGHTVSNLTVNNANNIELEGAGLFGWLNGGKISGIKLNNATVTAKSSAGALVGVAHTGAISGCHVTGEVKITAHYKVGGLTGGGYASIANCSVAATGDSSVTGLYKGNNLEGDNVGGLVGFRGEGNVSTTGCSVSGLKVSGSRKVGGLIGSAYADNKVEGCSVSNVSLVCNAPYDYASGALVKKQLCVGGLIGIFHKNDANGGTMKDCSVSGISMSIADPEVAKEGWPILGLVSGGYRASSISGASAPDGKVNIENLKVEGNNTGSNAEEKFPGSVAMNGTSSVFEKGSGTAEDPYIISSVDDLKLLQKSVSTTGITYEGQYLKLADGVEFDLSGEKWTSIGTSSHKFMGTFDGNGATIKGLSNPLFGGVEDVTIENVTLDAVDIREETATDYRVENYGALVSGNLKGTCVIRGVEVAGSVSGIDYIGGIFGGRGTMDADDSLLVEGCVNRATVTSRKKAGGIAGYILNRKPLENGSVTVKNCKNEGVITGQYVGGITGMTAYATYEGCENTGVVNGTETAGGIVGEAYSGTSVTSCKNSAQITCDTVAGGIVGKSASGGNKVSKSANTGDITGVTNAGGIIGGTASAGDTVENCYNGGAITATGEGAIAAGIYGYNNSTSPVKACFNDGAIKAEKGTVYQIGKSTYWYDQATGSKNASCYYMGDDGAIYAVAKDGADNGIAQPDMTRGELADVLNKAGGVENFWQAQNDSVQPDPLIPGAMDDKEKLVVQVLDADGKPVEGYESVSAAFAAVKDGQTIKLVKDADISKGANPVKLPAGIEATLDLAGHTLTVANTKTGSLVVKGDLTLVDSSDTKKDGSGTGKVHTQTVYTGGDTGYGMIRVAGGGSFTMESGLVDAESFTPNNAGEGQSAIVLENVTGDASVTINGGKVLAGWYAVSGNGNNKVHEGTITVNGGELISKADYAIYSPQAGGVTINGGTISGACGAVHIQRGKLTVKGGKLVSEGTGSTGTWGDGTSGSGNATVNFAGKYGEVNAEITGGSFIARNNAEMFHKGESNPVNASVSGGSFSHKVPEGMLAEGFGNNLEKGEDGLYRVHKHDWADKFESDANGHWHVCSKCDEKTEVAAHVKKIVGDKPATCGEDGYTGDIACADCGYVIKKGAVIPATGKHTAGDAWKTDGASHWHECAGCGTKLDEAKHTSSKWTVNDTDHWHLCDVCGAPHDVAPHDFGDWKVTKAATATEAGSREHTCKTCGKIVVEAIPALGSKPGDKPAEGDKLAQTGDASLMGAAAAGISGISAALAGVFTSRRRKEE